MALAFKKGQPVRQVAPVVTGTITDQQIIDDQVQYKVEYTDAAGEVNERWFKEQELEAV